MFAKYVETLAKHAKSVFRLMTGTEVLSYKVKKDERTDESVPLAHVISYEHMDRAVKGDFVLGFANLDMALAVASALAEKMGLGPLNSLDEVATDLLNEFMNTIVGHTISEWDRMGMPVRFSPPTRLTFSKVQKDDCWNTQAYVVILSLTFSHVIFRVTFREEVEVHAKNRRVLVVEDSAVVRNVIARTLEKNRFEVEQADNGKKAIEIYKQFQPHLVMMDLVMPQMGGFEAIESIKKFDQEARFIVLTSTSRRDQVLTAKKLGVKAYLIKPFNSDLMMREVNKVFAQPPDQC